MENITSNKPLLSLCTHFYNSSKGIAIQIERWKNITRSHLAKIEFVVVDDCSDLPYKHNIENLPIEWWRITTEIDWNQSGAKNLLLTKSKADWLLFFDVDQSASADSIQTIVDQIPSLDRSCYYMFRVDPIWGQQSVEGRLFDGSGTKLRPAGDPHINTFLIHRSLLDSINGFEEDYAGRYGFEDTHMHNQLDEKGHQPRLLDHNITFNVIDTYTTNLLRHSHVNQHMFVIKAKGRLKNITPPITSKLRFDYQKLLPIANEVQYAG